MWERLSLTEETRINCELIVFFPTKSVTFHLFEVTSMAYSYLSFQFKYMYTIMIYFPLMFKS
jgi:hypothetical protein